MEMYIGVWLKYLVYVMLPDIQYFIFYFRINSRMIQVIMNRKGLYSILNCSDLSIARNFEW